MRVGLVGVGLALVMLGPAFAEDASPQASPAAPSSADAKPSAPPSADETTPSAPAEPAVPSPAPSQTTETLVNDAKLGDTVAKGGVSPAILRAEVMLDRVHASPGVIDGRNGKNFKDAVDIYATAKDIKESHGLDAKVWDALVKESPGPVLMDYTLTEKDVEGPFMPDIPKDYAKQAELKTLAYHSPAQKIGALFHMSEGLLAALNPGVDLGKAGTKLLVANVKPEPIHGNLQRIVVDKKKGMVLAYDRHGRILAAYPATIGSTELPSPTGTYKVKGVAFNPIYYYNPKNFLQGDNHEKLKLPPGPNNPVGSVFIALTKPTYGLHGTPDPDEIDKTASHGCVRMTNWDARELAHLVKPGIVVHFKS